MSSLRKLSHRGIGLAASALLAVVLAACGASGPAASTPSSSFKLQSEYVKLVQDVGPSVVMIGTASDWGRASSTTPRATS
jgi:hypothetical protein